MGNILTLDVGFRKEALWLVLIGMAGGLLLIFAVTRLAATLLFDMSPTDPFFADRSAI